MSKGIYSFEWSNLFKVRAPALRPRAMLAMAIRTVCSTCHGAILTLATLTHQVLASCGLERAAEARDVQPHRVAAEAHHPRHEVALVVAHSVAYWL